MTDARTKAEQLAAEKYRVIAIDGVPSGHAVRNAFIDGYLAARTITAEELEAAAKVVFEGGTGVDWEDVPLWGRAPYVDLARAAFEAVGLRVESGE